MYVCMYVCIYIYIYIHTHSDIVYCDEQPRRGLGSSLSLPTASSGQCVCIIYIYIYIYLHKIKGHQLMGGQILNIYLQWADPRPHTKRTSTDVLANTYIK